MGMYVPPADKSRLIPNFILTYQDAALGIIFQEGIPSRLLPVVMANVREYSRAYPVQGKVMSHFSLFIEQLLTYMVKHGVLTRDELHPDQWSWTCPCPDCRSSTVPAAHA